MTTYGATVSRNRSDLVTLSQAVARVEHGMTATNTRSDGGWEAECLCGKVVETPHGTRRHAEIALENHITTLCEWADVAEEARSPVYLEHQPLERYEVERAAPTLRSDLSEVPDTTRAVAAYSWLLDRMLDKETRDVLQVLDDYIESELHIFREAYVVIPVVPSTLSGGQDPALSGEHDPAFSGEQAPVFSDEQDPAFSDEQDPPFSDEHALAFSGEQAPAFGEEHDLAFSGEQVPAFVEEHDLAFSGQHAPAFVEEHDLAFSGEQAPEFVEEHDLVFSASTPRPRLVGLM